jgi:hypothetical protein
LIRLTKSKIKKDFYNRGVIARRQERERLKKVKLLKSSYIPLELLEPILDPEKALTKEYLKLLVDEELISYPGFSGVEISDSTISLDSSLIDPALLDPIALQKDYISCLESSSAEEEEEEEEEEEVNFSF